MSKDITSKIQSYILERPFVMQYLQEGIININGLADKISHSLNIKANKTTIAMAIRRLNLAQAQSVQEALSIKDVLSESTYTIQTNLVEIRIPRESFKNELLARKDTLDIIKSHREIAIVMPKYQSVEFLAANKVYKSIADINSITLTMPAKYKTTPSIYFLLFREFALSGINILSFRTVFDDVKIYLSDDMTDKAYKLLTQLCRTASNAKY